MTLCALVTEETAEPGEGATFCAIWPALPILSVWSPPTSLASGSPLMLPMMRPPTSLRRRQFLGRSQELVCEDGGEQPRGADSGGLSTARADMLGFFMFVPRVRHAYCLNAGPGRLSVALIREAARRRVGSTTPHLTTETDRSGSIG